MAAGHLNCGHSHSGKREKHGKKLQLQNLFSYFLFHLFKIFHSLKEKNSLDCKEIEKKTKGNNILG